ncbi:LysM peptidoglycan-binding domain-containing protein [Cellulomonas oligotrophica]|uniref:Nucleoid-associated protein YgaU n=1 Tax=Cellulomonas oligotrophica TaxID=931536 RepID=A0A7Y9FFP8_9CELL|nr:LysM domain-containing protein [Cellulomonas oligotrophica]NYD85186.1 nucleoid-associated protein YgaU [Cellulomonas oligotrophica]GIG34161.1 hypothetical protein Col01nite_33200 [Cellulomonas oligotrophica]
MHQQNDSPPAHRALLVLAPGLLALGAAAALVLRATAVAGTTVVWRVDDVVAVSVVVLGALAALWVGLSAAVASLCVLARAAGRTWRAGEHAVERFGPGIVRRALTVLVAAGVGLGAATGAQASAEPAPPAVVTDLGWAPTTQSPEPTGGDTPAEDAALATTGAPADEAPASPPETDPAAQTAGTGGTGAGTTAPAQQAPPTRDATPPARAVGHGPGPSAPSSPAPSATTSATDAAGATAATAAGATTSTVTATVAPAEPSGASPGGTVIVRPGDTLWSLTARHLGDEPTDAEIAAAWPRWYAANAASIGPDPDLLHPGQVLVVPATTDGSTR